MLENKEFYIKLKEEEFKVELIKFSDTSIYPREE